MPIFSSVRRPGKADSSTSRMILSFSEAGHVIRRPPHPRHAFFEQTIFDGQFGNDRLHCAGLATQVLDLVWRRGPFSPIRNLSSAEKCRRVARRIFFTTYASGSFTGTDFRLIFAP
jgi:hypothetical protein